jgi:prolyl-tRNA synthetase
MAHSDDEGLVLPPRIAPLQVVIVPIYKGPEQKALVDEKVNVIISSLKSSGVTVKYDDSENQRPGWKFAEYELKGVPVRIAIGQKDIENGVVEIARRDTKEKKSVPAEGVSDYIINLLEEIQQNLYNRALAHRDNHITEVNSWDEFKSMLTEKGGFISAHWDGTAETEEKIKEETKATIRCVPLNNAAQEGACVYSGRLSTQRVLFALAY